VIRWPEVLCDARHNRTRQAIDAALRRLAVETDPVRKLQFRQYGIAHCELLQTELRDRIAAVPCAEYLSARNFLASLRCQLAHPSPRADREFVAAQ
jgi:hypothetical protein